MSNALSCKHLPSFLPSCLVAKVAPLFLAHHFFRERGKSGDEGGDGDGDGDGNELNLNMDRNTSAA